jgi:hypothetical protein
MHIAPLKMVWLYMQGAQYITYKGNAHNIRIMERSLTSAYLETRKTYQQTELEIKYVSFFTTAFDRNILSSGKYLATSARDERRSTRPLLLFEVNQNRNMLTDSSETL